MGLASCEVVRSTDPRKPRATFPCHEYRAHPSAVAPSLLRGIRYLADWRGDQPASDFLAGTGIDGTERFATECEATASTHQGIPMKQDRGRRIRLSPYRRFMADMLHFAMQVPVVPVERAMVLGPLAQARAAVGAGRPSWTSLFVRGFGLMAQEFAEFRRAWIKFPVPHLYEHPVSICAVAVERVHLGEHVVLAGLVRAPEHQTVHEIHAYLQRLKTAPIESIGYFRRLQFTSRLPRPIRRFLWWSTLHASGYKRAKRLGTFGLSSYGRLGAEQLRPLCPLTSLLTFGAIDPAGRVRVRIVYDHRVMDGAQVARALSRLEEIMNETLAAELTRSPFTGASSPRRTQAA